ncbi:hypothetical protein FPV67DRAFT_1453988 [Lyophyllum atratum]|nr:hypothetical protein FPV67DRAFT_1453988 [Lyophyllum atratum]
MISLRGRLRGTGPTLKLWLETVVKKLLFTAIQATAGDNPDHFTPTTIHRSCGSQVNIAPLPVGEAAVQQPVGEDHQWCRGCSAMGAMRRQKAIMVQALPDNVEAASGDFEIRLSGYTVAEGSSPNNDTVVFGTEGMTMMSNLSILYSEAKKCMYSLVGTVAQCVNFRKSPDFQPLSISKLSRTYERFYPTRSERETLLNGFPGEGIGDGTLKS